MMEIQIDLFADIACPWCYIGESRLAKALADRPDLQVTWRWNPYQLQPDMPPGGMPWEQFAAAKFGAPDQAAAMFEQVRQVGADEGLELNFQRISHAPNTADAHRLILHAAGQGSAREMAEALFHAYFGEGENVSDGDVLTRVAADVGLDAAEVERMLASGEGLEDVSASQENAARLGISGVPFYIFNGRIALSGAQPVETFTRAIEMALQDED